MTKQLEDLVPDLKICQEAKAKGVEIESIFYWRVDELKKIPICVVSNCQKEEAEKLEFRFKYYPAPLTDEILEKLPAGFNIGGIAHHLEIIKQKNGQFTACYYSIKNSTSFFCFNDKKLSNSLYLLYMKLKSDGII